MVEFIVGFVVGIVFGVAIFVVLAYISVGGLNTVVQSKDVRRE